MTSTFQSLPPPTPPSPLATTNNGGGNHPSTDAHSGGFGTVFLVLAVILVVSALACFLGRLCNKRSLSRQSKAKPPSTVDDHHDDHHRRHQQKQTTTQKQNYGGGGGGSGGGGSVGGFKYKFPDMGGKERPEMRYGREGGEGFKDNGGDGKEYYNNDIEFGLVDDQQKPPIPKIKIPASRYVDAGRGQTSRRDEMDDGFGRSGGGGDGGGGGGGRVFTMMGSPANYR